jgi:HEPN domain-containing protein
MCQQAIEKLVKGLYILYIDDNFPRIHEIQKLIRAFENKLSVPISEEQYKFFLNSLLIISIHDTLITRKTC